MAGNEELTEILAKLRRLHANIRDAVIGACERTATAELASIDRDEDGDTIYLVDRVSEELIVEFIDEHIAHDYRVVLIAEGLADGKIVLPSGATDADAAYRIIFDPIDGTRCIMYQKRSAWILTGVAPNKGDATAISDIELAVQTEIPLVKQHLCDTLWAIRGEGAFAERLNRLTGETTRFVPRPSRSNTIAHGFAQLARFFPGAREELAAIDEEVVRAVLGEVRPGKAHCFEDQYTSTGGQLAELMYGHDRFTADLRPLMEKGLNERGLALGICCHPYDICTELIARELGVIITDEKGTPINAPLAVEPDVCWVGFANEEIRAQIEPHLHESLRKRGLIAG